MYACIYDSISYCYMNDHYDIADYSYSNHYIYSSSTLNSFTHYIYFWDCLKLCCTVNWIHFLAKPTWENYTNATIVLIWSCNIQLQLFDAYDTSSMSLWCQPTNVDIRIGSVWQNSPEPRIAAAVTTP